MENSEVDLKELKTFREGNKVIIIMPTEEDAKKLCKIMHNLKDMADTIAMLS